MRYLVFIAIAASLQAQDLKLPAELQPSASMALSTAPEFGSMALLRLVESGRIADRNTSIGLLDQAFTLAANGHFRVSLRVAGSLAKEITDTRAGSLAKAYGLRLDTLSLQSRAVIAMLRVDPVRAREMFQSMSVPELAPLTCQDALVYDAGPLYQALGAVAQSGFNAKERARQDHVAFLLQYAAGVHAAAQIAPMLSALKAAGLTPAQFEAVAIRVGGQMETISGDARSFAASVDEVTNAVPPALGASLQKYVEKNQGVAACKDGEAQQESYWKSSSAEQLMAGARKLRFGDVTTKVLSDAERGSTEWKQQLADFEKNLAAWEASSEKSEMDYYQQKCIVYEALVELIPAGPDRDKALQDFLLFVNRSNLQSQSPAEWFLPVAAMLDRVRNTNGGAPGKMLELLEATGTPAMLLYASLESALDPGYPSWVTSGTGR